MVDLADSLFDQCSLEEQADELSELPVEIVVRRISRQQVGDQAEMLSRLPDDLASESGVLAARLSVGS